MVSEYGCVFSSYCAGFGILKSQEDDSLMIEDGQVSALQMFDKSSERTFFFLFTAQKRNTIEKKENILGILCSTCLVLPRDHLC